MNKRFDIFKTKDFDMSYMVWRPDDCTDLPLLIYLHGAGERGTDLTHLYRHGIPKLLSEGREYPAVVLCPQCPCEFVWDNIVVCVKELIDKIADEFSIKPDRICITGSSMGGYGTWMMGETYGNFFSGIAPVSGGGMAWRGTNLVTTPVYAVHGKQDDLVLPVCTEMMCERIARLGGNVKYLPLAEYGHNDAINYAYANTDLVEWLLSCRRTDFSPVPEFCSEWF